MDLALIVSEISGSIGLLTYSRNHYGPYVKTKLTQPPSATTTQLQRRAAITAAAAAWRNISEASFLDWSNYVNSHARSKQLSRKVRLSAFNEFCGRYVNQSLIGGSLSNLSPWPYARAFPYITGITIAPASLVIAFESKLLSSPCTICIAATAPLSPGINHPNLSAFRYLTNTPFTINPGTTDVFAAYSSAHSLTAADIGKQIGISLWAVNTDNFAASKKSYALLTITADLIATSYRVQLSNDDYYQVSRPNYIKSTFTEPSNLNKVRGKLYNLYNY